MDRKPIEARYGDILWLTNKLVLDPAVRDQIADRIAAMIREGCGFAVDLEGDEIVSAIAGTLKAEGVTPYPASLTPHEIAEMRAFFEGCANRVRDNSVLAHVPGDVMQAPHVWKLVADQTLLEAIQVYLGAPPTLVDVSAWWAMPQAGDAWGAQIYHRDVNDFRSCKLFFYLTDCGADDGPHIFVKRSHDPGHVRQRLAAAGGNPDDYTALFAGSGRHLAPQIERLFGPDVIEMQGAAGTCFVENTYGFHRAKIPTRRPRLLVQALYSLIDYPHRMATFEPHRLARFPEPTTKSAQTQYAMRLMVR